MDRTLQVLLVVLVGTKTTAFFEYKADCSPECQRQRLPCTITELSPAHFPCNCIDNNEDCIQRASSKVACITPDAGSIGGQEIWIPYWNYTHPEPPVPTPAPAPAPEQGTNFLQIYAAVLTTILILYGGTDLLRCVLQTYRRRHYQQLAPERAPSGGMSVSTSQPYQPTTQEV